MPAASEGMSAPALKARCPASAWMTARALALRLHGGGALHQGHQPGMPLALRAQGGEPGEFGFPGAGAVAMGAARVGGDQRPAVGQAVRPALLHQQRMDSTAYAAVSWSVPTVTQPVFAATS